MGIIIRENFSIELYGLSGVAVNQNWANTGMSLGNNMWQEVKSKNLNHLGINVWVYESANKMFVGVDPVMVFACQIRWGSYYQLK